MNSPSNRTHTGNTRVPIGESAETFDELLPLVQSCKTGNLEEVRDWIEADRPVNLPPPIKGRRRKGPLQKAIESGFYSIVEVLLQAGAALADSRPFALECALEKRRLDIVKLLTQYGADLNAVEMRLVFETWQPEIIDYFIENGANIETGNPLAVALCEKIKPALGVLKRHRDRLPQLRAQADIALRFHCREGDVKWVSLMLWAGADPYSKGPGTPYDQPDPNNDICAIHYAATWNRPEIFDIKQLQLTPDIPVADELFEAVCRGENADLLLKLLDKGFNPTLRQDSGSDLIQACFSGMDWPYLNHWVASNKRNNIDTSRSREKIKMIFILAKHGARWNPTEQYEIENIRRTLLKMQDDYTVEFVWIMSKFKSCKRESISQLLRTPSIRKLISKYQTRIDEIIKDIPE